VQTIHVATTLPTSADRVWPAMQSSAVFLYVCKGLFGVPALQGRSEPLHAGERGSAWLFAFHLIPAHRHTIEVLEVNDATRTIRTHEYGGVIAVWKHTLHVQSIDERTCRYSDTVAIDAGRATAAVTAIAVGIFRYRQRRWHKLVRKHLLPDGPAHAI
jgi:hypothetical protein